LLRISGHYITSQRTFNDTYLTSQEPTVHTISEPQTLNAAAGLTQGSPTNTPQLAAPTQVQPSPQQMILSTLVQNFCKNWTT